MISAQEKLNQLLETKQIPHALLITGSKESGKQEAIYKFAHALLGTKKKLENHPDFHQYFPEGKVHQHPIQSMRQLIDDVAFTPFEAKWKIYLIHEAERMLPTSSNALLKTFEEPTARTLILLLSHHPEKLLPTIVSRCQTLEFSSQENFLGHPGIFDFLEKDFAFKSLKDLPDEDAESVFKTLLFWFRDRLLLEIGGCEQYLSFPQKKEKILNSPLIPLEDLEKGISYVQLAHERATKLSLCVEMLFLSLSGHHSLWY